MTDRQLLALIIGGVLIYAWMLWHLVTRAGTQRAEDDETRARHYDDVA